MSLSASCRQLDVKSNLTDWIKCLASVFLSKLLDVIIVCLVTPKNPSYACFLWSTHETRVSIISRLIRFILS